MWRVIFVLLVVQVCVALVAPHEARGAWKEAQSLAVGTWLSGRIRTFVQCCSATKGPTCPCGNPRDTNTCQEKRERAPLTCCWEKVGSFGTDEFSFSEQSRNLLVEQTPAANFPVRGDWLQCPSQCWTQCSLWEDLPHNQVSAWGVTLDSAQFRRMESHVSFQFRRCAWRSQAGPGLRSTVINARAGLTETTC